MPLVILRCVFFLTAAGAAVRLVNSNILPTDPWVPWVVLFGVLFLAVSIIVADILLREKQLDTISSVYFGLIVGLFLTYVLNQALAPLYPDPTIKDPSALLIWRPWVQLVLGLVLCYGCISVLLQTKNDFRFIIPYVEFSKEVKTRNPYILDTSVVIDGRIADIVATKILDNQLVMPRFIISELQAIADSSERLRRNRGRRGLDILNQLRTSPGVDLNINELELPEFAGKPVDEKLVLLAKKLHGRIVTNDYNLNKVAQLHGVGVINLNDIANALKPTFVPGENIEVRVIKAGEEAGQGVGYLDDGTMIVIEDGRDYIDKNIHVAVTSVLQTSAGRMIFGKFESEVPTRQTTGEVGVEP